MLRLIRPMILVALAGSALTPVVRAQSTYNLSYDYYPRTIYTPIGYKLYGWTGWGVPPQIRGDMTPYVAHAMGIYAQEAAVRKSALEARAERQRDEMISRWNIFYWSAQHALELFNVGGRIPKSEREAAQFEADLVRLRDRPTPEEIESGSALNALLDQLTDPRINASAFRSTQTPLNKRLVRRIPYVYATEVITILLDRVTDDARWPSPLAIPELADSRRDLRAATAAALKEDQDGELSEAAVKEVHRTLQKLANRMGEVFRPGTPRVTEAETYLKELVGLARLLGRPDFEAVLAASENAPSVTVEDLLGFMRMYNLRFGEPETPAQKEGYRTLYPILHRWRDDLPRRLGLAFRLPEGALTLADLRREAPLALAIFASMSWEELTSQPTPGSPELRR